MNSDRTDVFRVMTFPVGPLQTNCYLVYDPLTLAGAVIDPGWHDEEMLRRIAETKVNVVCVINTHGHADHIAGNSDFTAPSFIHRLDECCLDDPFKNLSIFSGSPVRVPKASGFLEDGELVKVGDLRLEVMHTPGHTPGGISLLSCDSVFSGDTLFYEGIGRTDLAGGDLSSILKSIEEKLMCLPDNLTVFPGHGPKTTIGEARKFIKREFSYRS